MPIKSLALLRGLLLAGIALGAAQAPARAESSPSGVRAEADRLAATVVAKMTLDEKVGQLVNVAPAIARLNIPAYNW